MTLFSLADCETNLLISGESVAAMTIAALDIFVDITFEAC